MNNTLTIKISAKNYELMPWAKLHPTETGQMLSSFIKKPYNQIPQVQNYKRTFSSLANERMAQANKQKNR